MRVQRKKQINQSVCQSTNQCLNSDNTESFDDVTEEEAEIYTIKAVSRHFLLSLKKLKKTLLSFGNKTKILPTSFKGISQILIYILFMSAFKRKAGFNECLLIQLCFWPEWTQLSVCESRPLQQSVHLPANPLAPVHSKRNETGPV